MTTRKTLALICILVLVSLALSACATSNPNQGTPLESTGKVYGFWNGLWDGMTALFAFIGNIFGGHWGIYQVFNNGGWYNFGYLIGIGAFAGVCGSVKVRRH